MEYKNQQARGTKDIIGHESEIFDSIIDLSKKFAKNNHFQTLHLPIFENAGVFDRNLGTESDIVSKEMYVFKDKSENLLALRPEFTASVMRHCIENNADQNTLPLKLFSYGPVFRYDRPQRGRYRQFNQLNFEIVGGTSKTMTDAYIIDLAYNLLKTFNIKSKLVLNILPLNKDKYKDSLIKYLTPFRSELSDDSKNRLEKNPLRILDSKDKNDIRIIQDAPKISEFLDEFEKEYQEELLEFLSQLNINFTLDSNLVRGLDYYTTTVFEFIEENSPNPLTILAGGRYDNLFLKMQNKSPEFSQELPCIGFSAGIERIALNTKPESKKNIKVAIIYPNTNDFTSSILLKNQLTEHGIESDVIIHGNSLSKRIKKASQLEFDFIIVNGESEKNSNSYELKKLSDSEVKKGSISEIISLLKNV